MSEAESEYEFDPRDFNEVEVDPVEIDPDIIDLPIQFVNLRIVGVYLGSVPGTPPDKNTTGDVTVVTSPNPTVEEVLAAARASAKNGWINGVKRFDYTVGTHKGNKMLQDVEVEYTKKPKPVRKYPPGVYSLQQDLRSDPMQVFQYYINQIKSDQGANELLRQNTDNSFKPLDQNKITDGNYVVWRLVSIRTNHDYMTQSAELNFENFGELMEAQMQSAQSNSPLQRGIIESRQNGGTEPELPDYEELPPVKELVEAYEERREE